MREEERAKAMAMENDSLKVYLRFEHENERTNYLKMMTIRLNWWNLTFD
jgi:hypothetical protein